MIGGEIEIDPEFSPPAKGRSIWEILDLPDGRSAFFGAARQAVRWWIDHLKPEGTMLLPAYCCNSVIQPFRDAGIAYRYYPVDRKLRTDMPALRKLVPGSGAIQIIHYFGFPADRALFDLGVPVLEDAVQAVLSPDLRKSGDWAIGSLRKYFPVSDGAFLLARRPFKVPRLPVASGGPYGRKLYGRMLKHEAVRLGQRDRWVEALDILQETESALDRDTVRYLAMSPRTSEALRGVDTGEIAAARRRNYAMLFDSLRGVFRDRGCGLAPLMPELAPGVVPYGLPVLSERRDALREHLAARGIYTVVHWDLPEDLTREAFPDSWWIYDRALTLPIDHRYSVADMAKIAAAVAAFKP
jgi:hypothetical protein